MARALPFIVPVALALYALIDLSRSTAVERAGLRPVAWAAIILLLPVVGPITWIVVSIVQRNAQGAPTGPGSRPRSGSGGSSTGRARPARRPGPLAPDDDPDFLWRLDQQQRRRRRGDAPDPTGAPESTAAPEPTAAPDPTAPVKSTDTAPESDDPNTEGPHRAP